MKVIVDERETALYELCINHENYAKDNFLLEKRVLQLGDILFTSDDESVTYLCIERKSFQDLLASIKDGRYTEQSYRLSNCYPNPHNVVYLLEGMLSTVKDKKTVISCIASLNYFKGFSVHRTVSMAETALYVLCMADKMSREFKKGNSPMQQASMQQASGQQVSACVEVQSTDYCNVVKVSKKANITKENIGQLILMQIPGISSTIAIELMRPFKSFIDFVDHIRTNPEYLSTVTVNQRKIGSNIVKGIQEFILNR
jgi:crossover junction endonuclease MUS81